MPQIALNLELPPIDGTAPEWVQLIPPGPSVTGRDGRAWLFDQPAATDVLSAFAVRAVDLAIDWNHALQLRAPQGEESPAAAWIDQLEVRDGGLWGHAAWTPRGRDQVINREYRYLSPVFDYDPESKRIARLVSAALTNTPNLRLTALNSEDLPVALPAAIAAALGLPADATAEVALAAVNQLKVTAQAANHEARNLDQFVPRADHDLVLARATNAETKLAEQAKAAHTAAVETAITGALEAGKITPATADYHRASCADQASLERFKAYVAAAPVVAPDQSSLAKHPAAQGTALNAEERYVADQLGIPHDTFRAKDH